MSKELGTNKKHNLFRGDYQIWIIVFILMLLSIVEVYSTTASLAYRNAGGNTELYLLTQFIILGFSGLVMFVVHTIPPGIYSRFALPTLLLVCVWLLAMFVLGTEVNGAKRWTSILGISLQPSEIVRLPLIIYISYTLAEKREQLKQFSYVLFPLTFIIALTCGLILLTNFSTAALIGLSCFILLLMSNIKWRHLFFILLLGAGSLFAFIKISPALPFATRVSTWISRLESFQNGEDSQALNAKIAVANGLIWGKGPGNSMQRLVLPESYDDYIFANIIEEGGLLIGILVIALYIWLLFRIYYIIRASRKPYYTYICAGFGILIGVQAFIHIAVTLGLGPVTGQPLPLISKGGTSALTTCIALGIIQSVARQQKKELYEGETSNVA